MFVTSNLVSIVSQLCILGETTADLPQNRIIADLCRDSAENHCQGTVSLESATEVPSTNQSKYFSPCKPDLSVSDSFTKIRKTNFGSKLSKLSLKARKTGSLNRNDELHTPVNFEVPSEKHCHTTDKDGCEDELGMQNEAQSKRKLSITESDSKDLSSSKKYKCNLQEHTGKVLHKEHQEFIISDPEPSTSDCSKNSTSEKLSNGGNMERIKNDECEENSTSEELPNSDNNKQFKNDEFKENTDNCEQCDLDEDVNEEDSQTEYRVPYYLENFVLILDSVLKDDLYFNLFNEDDLAIVKTFQEMSGYYFI